MQILPEPQWRERATAHEARVDAVTSAHLERRREHRTHPVEDFLFTYYNVKPGQLRRWHPGPGVALEAAPGSDVTHRQWRFYAERDGVVALDTDAFLAARGDTVRFVRDLVGRTAARPPRFGCFGMHEWAMVYRLDQDEVRHAAWPLRLGPEGTDAVVEANPVACSHFDAYRFFTPAARPLNALRPTRQEQAEFEQPGCLHAGMDVYKWATKLAPAVPSELVMDAFDLAREIRSLDMRASPYDLSALGYEPVPVETPEGKARYSAEQRAFTERSQDLRRRLLAAVDQLLGAASDASAPSSPTPASSGSR